MGPSYQPVSPSNFGYYNAPKKRLNLRLLLIILGFVVVIFVVFAIIANIASRDNLGSQEQRLELRLQNLSSLTVDGGNHLQNADLVKINAEADIINDGVFANMGAYLPSAKKIDKTIAADESNATTSTTLANAALAGTYDTQYKLALQQQLESLSALLTEMYGKTKSASLKSTLNTDYINYQALLTNLAKITV